MKFSRANKKLVAVICAVAMVVCSFTIYGAVNVVAPSNITLTKEYEGGTEVPGCVRVGWTPGDGTPAAQTYRIYVDGELVRSDISGTSMVVNNISSGTHTIGVKGYFNQEESEGVQDDITLETGVKYSTSIAVEGFQIRSNYDESQPIPEPVAFRTVCKTPNVGSTIKVGGTSYTIASFGTSYCLDTNNDGYANHNVLDASYCLLNETPVTGHQYQYTGKRTYQGQNRTFGYVASDRAILSEYKPRDVDNTYYAFTMENITTEMPYTMHIRPFVVATNGTIIYGKVTSYTSVTEIGNYLYVNSMSKNRTSHQYIYDHVVHKPWSSPNRYYRDSEVDYGWNGNLYIGFRQIPDSWNGQTGQEEMQYVVVGDYRVHASTYYDGAKASYKGDSNEELAVRVDDPGHEKADEWGTYNWGIQIKLPNESAYSRLQDGKWYRMKVMYNVTNSGSIRIKPEGNGVKPGGGDQIYDFDCTKGDNVATIDFQFNRWNYIEQPGADPSVVFALGRFTPEGSSSESGGLPKGTIFSDLDITFEEIPAP